MRSLVLIDSSVWIAASRGVDELLTEEVTQLLGKNRAAMTWPVWVELHQGARGKREEQSLKGWREVSHWLTFDDHCWKEAAAICRTCIRSGVNVPFGDVLVQACAKRHGVGLLEKDRHFAMIQKAMGW